MTQPEFQIEAGQNAADVYAELQPAYHAALSAPQDDMWASFADAAQPYALLVNNETAGFSAVNEDGELLAFYLQPSFEQFGARVLKYVSTTLKLQAGVCSTVDPFFLSLCIEVGESPATKALVYRHVTEPECTALTGLRVASMDDHEAAIAFDEAAIGAPRAFLEPYLGARIQQGELYLHDSDGAVAAVGECRVDQRKPGYAHLGIVVGTDHRGKGLGRSLMHALVLEARRQNLQPVCSTEPENLAAQRAIESTGFRAQHRVFRVAFAS